MFVKTISFRSEPFINPLYYGFLSNEIWASLWSWIFSKLDKVFIININSKHQIYLFQNFRFGSVLFQTTKRENN